jgi:NADH pyrophosphatase NudC (nudix superfamily)
MTKVTVWICSEHGEIELLDWKEPLAYCPKCGKEMKKVGEYEE